jgi:hypothetical protein
MCLNILKLVTKKFSFNLFYCINNLKEKILANYSIKYPSV